MKSSIEKFHYKNTQVSSKACELSLFAIRLYFYTSCHLEHGPSRAFLISSRIRAKKEIDLKFRFFFLNLFLFLLSESNSEILQAFLIPLLVLERVLNHDLLSRLVSFLEFTEVNVKRLFCPANCTFN